MLEAQEETHPCPTRVDAMPLARLRDHATDARRILRNAQKRVGTVGGLYAIDSALDDVERLLPGLMDRREGAALLAMRALAPEERAALRGALRAGRDTALVRDRTLGGMSAEDALDALERVVLYEALAADVMRLLQAIETEHSLATSPMEQEAAQ